MRGPITVCKIVSALDELSLVVLEEIAGSLEAAALELLATLPRLELLAKLNDTLALPDDSLPVSLCAWLLLKVGKEADDCVLSPATQAASNNTALSTVIRFSTATRCGARNLIRNIRSTLRGNKTRKGCCRAKA